MKKFEGKDNHGCLFVNRKKLSDGQPDYVGSLQLDGVSYRLGGWVRSGASGNRINLKFARWHEKPLEVPDPGELIGEGSGPDGTY